MKRIIAAATLAAIATPAFAQQSTAVGTGVGVAKSQSASQATAIGGGNATGGNATGGNAKSYSTSNGGNPIAAINIAASPATTTLNENVNNTGTSTVKNVPSVFSPGLAAAGLETCIGSVSGGGSFVGTGFSFGSTIPDPGCGARLDARTLWSFGLKKAAVARLCLNSDIYNSMPEVCAAYLPARVQQTAYAVAGPTWPTFPGWGRAAVVPSIAPEDNGGPVEVVVARTGEHRICKTYDSVKHRCLAWVR